MRHDEDSATAHLPRRRRNGPEARAASALKRRSSRAAKENPAVLPRLARAALPLAAVLLAIFAVAAPVLAAPRHCPVMPAPVRKLDLGRYYTDQAGTRIDPEKRAEKARATEPLKRFLRRLAADTDLLWLPEQSRQRLPWRRVARCTGAALVAWAEAEALMGEMTTKQARYERNWAFAGLAVSYMKLRPHLEPPQRLIIDRWLLALAERCQRFLDDPARQRNNHRYWLGLGLAAVGIGLSSRSHWRAAEAIYREAAKDITRNGTLPLEMARGRRALHYHNFAAQPLFAMALLARARGEDWARFNGGALHRLVRLIDAVGTGCDRHRAAQFETAAGSPVEGIPPRDYELTWRRSYALAFPAFAGSTCRPVTRRGPRPRASNDHRLGGGFAALQRAARHYHDIDMAPK